MSGGDDFDGPPPPKRKVTGATDHSGKLSQSSRARQRRLAELMGAAYETLAQSSTDLTGMVPREKVRLERPQGRRYEMSQEQVEAYQESQLKNAADIKKLLEMLSKQYQKAEEQEAHDMVGIETSFVDEERFCLTETESQRSFMSWFATEYDVSIRRRCLVMITLIRTRCVRTECRHYKFCSFDVKELVAELSAICLCCVCIVLAMEGLKE